jgi:hypothetical protein
MAIQSRVLPSRLERSPTAADLDAMTQRAHQLLQVLTEHMDALCDRRIREVRISRVGPLGEWQVDACLSFESLSGQPRPFKPEEHVPKRWRSREERQHGA